MLRHEVKEARQLRHCAKVALESFEQDSLVIGVVAVEMHGRQIAVRIIPDGSQHTEPTQSVSLHSLSSDGGPSCARTTHSAFPWDPRRSAASR